MAQFKLKKFQCSSCSEVISIQIKKGAKTKCPSCDSAYSLDTVDGKVQIRKIRNNPIEVRKPSSKIMAKQVPVKKAKTQKKVSKRLKVSQVQGSRRQQKSGGGFFLGIATAASLMIIGFAANHLLDLNLVEAKISEPSMAKHETTTFKVIEVKKAETPQAQPEPDVKAKEPVVVMKEELIDTNSLLATVTTPPNEEIEIVPEIEEEPKLTDELTFDHEEVKQVVSREVSFLRDIRPILESKCINCHGAERQKGDLRMDTRTATLKGGDSGPSMVPGKAEDSLIYQAVMLDESDDDHMPAKGDPLTQREKESLKIWINNGAEWKGVLVARKENHSLLKLPPVATKAEIIENPELQAEQSYQIDQLITDYFKENNIEDKGSVSDQVYVKRAYLDIAGRIPTLPEYERFISSKKAGKRESLVDELVDSPAYVSHTLNQWLDAMRVRYQFHKVTAGQYIQWIRNAIEENMPYDQFVHAQLSAQGSVYEPGNAAGYFIRDRGMPQDRVTAAMQTFLGTSMVCAQCHDHPLAEWTQMDFYKLMAFFGGTSMANGGVGPMMEDIKVAQSNGIKIQAGKDISRVYGVLGDRVLRGGFGMIKLPHDYQYKNGLPGQWIKAAVPFGPKAHIDYSVTYEDPSESISNKSRKKLKKSLAVKEGLADVNSRATFASWVTSKDNPMFAKTIVNRLWHRAFGVPLVGDLVDIGEQDMGKSPRLTAYLIKLMKNLDFDQKLFMKILYKTSAYQRIAFPQPTPGEMPLGAPVIQRLSAEQVWDSIVTLRTRDPDAGVTEGTLSPSGAKYVELNLLKDPMDRINFVLGKKKHSPEVAAMKAFGTNNRSLSLMKRASLMPAYTGPATFFGMFGRAQRETIDDSVREPTIPQVLYLMNGIEVASLMNEKRVKGYKGSNTEQSEVINRSASKALSRETIGWVYNAVLSRDPSSKELMIIKSKFNKNNNTGDLFWALINTTEFKMKL